MRSKAIFLDKDGTLVEDIPYNVDPELIRPTEGALEALQLLDSAGYQLIVVSNQSGVARGLFPEDALLPVERKLRAIFAEAGVSLVDFYYCPHHPQGSVPEYTIDCTCRKPKPGMLVQAAREHHVDLAASWMVGDILNDVEAGNAAGCQTVLMDNGHESEWILTPERSPDIVVKDLFEAARAVTETEPLFGWTLKDNDTQQRSHKYD